MVLMTLPLQASPIFNYTLGSGITSGDPVYNAFVAAGNRWSSIFADSVTVNVKIDYKSLGAGILGSTGSAIYKYSYSSVKAALAADATTATDATAVANLQAGSALTFAINHTADCSNCTIPYLDNNANNDNLFVDLTGAQARALGLLAPNAALDGQISFSSNFAFDFDPTDGISASQYDLVGVATHEIGHLLGFVSSVDDFDFCGANPASCGGLISEAQDEPTILDLYRFSTTSGFGTIMDMSADNRAKYFSLDGGTTLGPLFSNGSNFGDGRQASHWKDSLGIGIMDPTAGEGELLAITQNDVVALDAIGWDSVVAPEPFTGGLFVIGIAVMAVVRKRIGATG